MNYLGSDFNSSGSVMAKAELTVARTKRGECVTCGRRCYRKKLFKMIPLDEPGKVLSGRCLNCKPLQAKDVSSSVSSKKTPQSNANGRNSSNSSSRGNRSIANSSSNSSNAGSDRRMIMRKKKSSSHPHHKSSPQFWKANSSKGITAANNGTKFPTIGEPKSPPDRTISTPISTSSSRNNYNRTHSTVSRITVDTALTSRPSIASISTRAARKHTGSSSTLSIGSTSSVRVGSKKIRKFHNMSTSGRSLAISDSFGSSICETRTMKSPEISWTPPPHHSDFDNCDEEKNQIKNDGIAVNSNGNQRPPSRINSFKSVKSTASKTFPPTREDLEEAALTLLAAREHGFMGAGGPLYEDLLDGLVASDQNFDSGNSAISGNHGRATDLRHKKHLSRVIDSIAESRNRLKETDSDECGEDHDGDRDTKFKCDESLNSSIIDSVRNSQVEPTQSFSKRRNQDHDMEQNSSIVESNVSIPKTVSVAEKDDQVLSMHSHQHSQQNCSNHRRKGILNRGGAFQPRTSGFHGPGTHILAGSTRTMSSMSSFGEEDNAFVQNALDQKQSQIPHRRQSLPRMGSFSRYRQGSCRTLGSLSTIEVINEEDIKIQSSLEDMSTGFSSANHISESSAPSVPQGEKVAKEDAYFDERKDPPDYSEEVSPTENLATVKNDLVEQKFSSPTKIDEEMHSHDDVVCNGFVNSDASTSTMHEVVEEEEIHFVENITPNIFKEHVILLQEFSQSPEKTINALEVLSAYGCDEEEIPSAIETVAVCMQSHATVYDVQLWGCRAIHNMALTITQAEKRIIPASVPSVITQAMKRYLENGEDLQGEAIRVLLDFAVNRQSVNLFVCKGDDAVEAIVAAMGQYPGNVGLQMTGCDVVATLASHNDPTVRLRIMEKSAGEAILFNAVPIHSGSCVIQRSALIAVRNLCIDCGENQDRLLDLGVVDPILSAMKKHRDPKLHEAGADAISILAGNNVETKKVIVENGGIKLLISAILLQRSILQDNKKQTFIPALLTLSLDSYNVNNPESRNSEENLKAAETIGTVIDALHEAEVGSPNLALVIDATINAMEAHEDVSAVQEIGFAILGGVADMVDEGTANTSDQTKMDIVDQGALDVINMAMVLHKHDARVQERACALLLDLAIEENYASIIAAIGIQLLEDATANFPGRCSDFANQLIERLIEEEGENED